MLWKKQLLSQKMVSQMNLRWNVDNLEMVEKIINEMGCANECPMHHQSHYIIEKCTCYKGRIIHALLQPKPVCKTCGGTKKKTLFICGGCGNKDNLRDTEYDLLSLWFQPVPYLFRKSRVLRLYGSSDNCNPDCDDKCTCYKGGKSLVMNYAILFVLQWVKMNS